MLLEDAIENTYELIRALRLEQNCSIEEAERCTSRASGEGLDGIASLLKKGREYLEKRELAQQALAEEELKQLRERPEILPMSRQLARKCNGEKPLVDRMQMFQQKAEKKQEMLRSEMRRKEVEAVRSAPDVNSKSRRLVRERKVEDRLNWESNRMAKLKSEREKKIQEEAAECKFTPTLNSKSRSLAVSAQERRKSRLVATEKQKRALRPTQSSTGRKASSTSSVRPPTTSSSNTTTSQVKRKGRVHQKERCENIAVNGDLQSEQDEQILLRCGGLSLFQESSLLSCLKGG